MQLLREQCASSKDRKRMGRYFKDSYASTYAARNVKEALDRLIDVLQSPAQVRKLVIGTAARKPLAPKLRAGKTISSESPASTPQGMHTSASAATKQLRNPKNAEPQALKESQKGDAIALPSSGNGPTEKTTPPSSSGSRASQTSESRDSNFQDHIPVGRFTQLWKKSLRDYPGGARNSRERQRSSPLQLEAAWSNPPSK